MGTTITQVDAIPLTDFSGPASIPRPRSVLTPHSVGHIPISRGTSPRVFEAEPTSTLNKSRRTLITTLVILASLTQVSLQEGPQAGTSAYTCKYAANFVMLAGGLAFSKRLGRDVGPGEANWMPAAYS